MKDLLLQEKATVLFDYIHCQCLHQRKSFHFVSSHFLCDFFFFPAYWHRFRIARVGVDGKIYSLPPSSLYATYSIRHSYSLLPVSQQILRVRNRIYYSVGSRSSTNICCCRDSDTFLETYIPEKWKYFVSTDEMSFSYLFIYFISFDILQQSNSIVLIQKILKDLVNRILKNMKAIFFHAITSFKHQPQMLKLFHNSCGHNIMYLLPNLMLLKNKILKKQTMFSIKELNIFVENVLQKIYFVDIICGY